MKIKDITDKQAEEILKLTWIPMPGVHTKKQIESHWNYYDTEFKYQPYDISMYEDAVELFLIYFRTKAIKNGNVKLRIIIGTNLDIEFSYYDKEIANVISLPKRNQYWVYKKFREWGLYPDEAEKREEEINKLV